MRINGVDLSDYGIHINSAVEGWKDAPRLTVPTVAVPGRGRVATGEPATNVRSLTAVGWWEAPTLAALRERRDAFWLATHDRDLTLALNGEPGRFYRARLATATSTALEPVLVQTHHEVRLTFEALDPYAYASEDTVVNFPAGTTAVPLGTAPVEPVVQLASVASPVLVYRDAAGAERGRMEFTGAISGNNRLIVDGPRRTLHLLDGTPAFHLLTGGDFFRLDPRHGGGLAGPWPTLEVTPVAGIARATYRRAYLSL